MLQPDERTVRLEGQIASIGSHGRWLEFLICVSWANLIFLRVWSETPIYLSARTKFLLQHLTTPSYYSALILSTLILAASIWGLRLLAAAGRPAGQRWPARVLLVGAGLAALNSLRVTVTKYTALFALDYWQKKLGYNLANIAVVGGAILFLFWMFKRQSEVRVLWERLALVFVPLAVIQCGMLFRCHFTPAATPTVHQDAPPAAALKLDRRVVWIVFDQWDYEIAFARRPQGLKLPEMDLLRSTSLTFEDAYSPARCTDLSIPALLVGERLREVKFGGDGKLWVKREGGSGAENLSDLPSFLTRAEAAGARVGLYGWYLPYCRMLGGRLERCQWWEYVSVSFDPQASYLETMASQWQGVLETKYHLLIWPSQQVSRHIRQLSEMISAGIEAVGEPGEDVVFLHLPPAHDPFVFDARTGTFRPRNDSMDAYLDGLRLADIMLGELRRSLERSGLADRTLLVATSDHPRMAKPKSQGERDLRVPAFLHWPRQESRIDFRKGWNTLGLEKLMLAFLTGRATSIEDIRRFADTGRAEPHRPLGCEFGREATYATK